MSTIWRVGMRAVCVRGPMRPRYDFEQRVADVAIDSVYTIRGILHWGGDFGFHFEEIRNPIFHHHYDDGSYEIAFHRSRFRPAIETKTDISIFTRILDRVKRGEPVDADA